MSEQYRLVFSGEVAPGQHVSVVKKRLTAVLKLDEERMDVLFSGKSVVVKKATDNKTAARYQEAFNKAGARLRVLPAEGVDDPLSSEATSGAETPQPNAPAVEGEMTMLPLGADMLTNDERARNTQRDVDTSHLSVQKAVFNVDEPDQPVEVPNVDHLTLAELGAQLGGGTSQEVVVAEIDADFDLAEVGAIIGVVDAEPVAAAVDVDAVDFDLAEPGADLDTTEKEPSPPPPDTSHLQLDDN